MRRAARLLLAFLLALGPAVAHAAVGPTGSWKFDQAALEAIGERVAEAMAVQAGPEQRAHMEAAVRDLEARHARLAQEDPDAARRMEPYLRQMQAQNGAMQTDPKSYFKRQFLGSVADLAKATLDLRPDGKVVVESPAGGTPASSSGTWKLAGKTIEIATFVPAGAGDAPQRPLRLRGTFRGKRMDLRLVEPPGETEDEAVPLAKAMRNATWVLVRR